MDNRAQVSLEYLIIISVLLTMSAVVMIMALGTFGLKDSLRNVGSTFKENALSMLD